MFFCVPAFEHCLITEILKLLKTLIQNFNRLFLRNNLSIFAPCMFVGFTSDLADVPYRNHLVRTGFWCLFDWNRLPCVCMFAHECKLNKF